MISYETLNTLLEHRPDSKDFKQAMQRLAEATVFTAKQLEDHARYLHKVMDQVNEQFGDPSKQRILICDDLQHGLENLVRSCKDYEVLQDPNNSDGIPTSKRDYGWYRQFEHKSKRRNFR